MNSYRYIGMTIPYDQTANQLQLMEDGGLEVFSVNTFTQAFGTGAAKQTMLVSAVMGRIGRNAPKTKLENEIDAKTKRLVQPVHGML